MKKLVVNLKASKNQLLEANLEDQELNKDISSQMMSRLKLNSSKIDSIIHGIEELINKDFLVGNVIKSTKLTEDLELKQILVPIGVIAIIFESRPDVFPQVLK